ncbi:MAG: RHS repeat-associated core domain-containing protein [Planctomycetia bacterium]|nr:RHS repeat-associated core domain-containing protein [Planctomycetia bacterium]
MWYNPAGTPGAATLSATDGDIGWGGVALSGWDALFDNLKVGYDADDDDDLDGSDDVVLDEDFSSTSVSPTHDDAGNLTKDADYAYVYDAWNNLVKVRAQNDADVVVGVYAYYADNRRASKTVTNRGDLDGATYFFYDGLREIEERNGAEAVTQQYVWGHEYIDQLLMIRGAGGTWFVHRDANWNVIALTTPNGDVAEEVQYQPYGSPQIRRHLAFGDSDADGDVDSADNTARTAALSTYNRTFDADFDGDVSNTSGDADQLAWEASYNDPAASTTMVIPNRGFSPSGNPFLFTGRRLDAETGLYFYRFRTYHPTLKTFLQRDPLGYGDSASLYQYVGGRPTAAGDPLGLQCGPYQIRTLLDKINSTYEKLWQHETQMIRINRLITDLENVIDDGQKLAAQLIGGNATVAGFNDFLGKVGGLASLAGLFPGIGTVSSLIGVLTSLTSMKFASGLDDQKEQGFYLLLNLNGVNRELGQLDEIFSKMRGERTRLRNRILNLEKQLRKCMEAWKEKYPNRKPPWRSWPSFAQWRMNVMRRRDNQTDAIMQYQRRFRKSLEFDEFREKHPLPTPCK